MDTFGYKLFFLLHIVAIVVAFAPGFVLPGIRRKVSAEGDGASRALASASAANDTRIHGPALVLAGLFGFGLIGMSDKLYKFDQPWISVGLLLWFIMLGMVFGVLLPAEKKVAAGDASALKLTNMAGGIIHLLFLLQVIDMIWKPGL
ncbi:hypothetical protein BH10ACT1_BH10ACT1_20330 [soil metagenome]